MQCCLHFQGRHDSGDCAVFLRPVAVRLAWIDIAKGIGIVLVVIGHTGRGLSGQAFSDGQELLSTIDQTIYAFHMPLFFILSGVTFGMCPPLSINPSLRKRVWRLIYPLVIWTYIFLALQALAGGKSNTQTDWMSVMIWPIPPVAHFWFLWALLLVTILLAVVRILCIPVMSDIPFWIGALVAASIVSFSVTPPGHLSPFFGASLRYLPVFAIGGLIGASSFALSVPNRVFALIAGTAFAIGLLATVSFDLGVPRHLSGAIISLLLIVLLMSISGRYARFRWAQGIAFLGNISLPIYVMHTIFSAGLRIMLLQVGIDSLPIHFVLGTIIGIIGPLFFYLYLKRLQALHYVGF